MPGLSSKGGSMLEVGGLEYNTSPQQVCVQVKLNVRSTVSHIVRLSFEAKRVKIE